MKTTMHNSVAGAAFSYWASCALLVLAGPCAFGQQVFQPADLATEPAVAEIRSYSVELIIFEYTQTNNDSTEIFLPDPLPAATENNPGIDAEFGVPAYGDDAMAPVAIPADDAFDDNSAQSPNAGLSPEELNRSENSSLQQAGFKLMTPAQYTLDEVYAKLVRLDAYRPLMRAGWTQQTLGQEESLAMPLRWLGDPPLRLDGEVMLYLGRYLHLVLDLSLQDSDSGVQGRTNPDRPASGDVRSQRNATPDPYAQTMNGPVIYRLKEDRIVRNGELRYFDHPRFGVVAKISRVEQAARPAGTDSAGSATAGGNSPQTRP
jgi:hypothetical protein